MGGTREELGQLVTREHIILCCPLINEGGGVEGEALSFTEYSCYNMALSRVGNHWVSVAKAVQYGTVYGSACQPRHHVD